jgi:predicted alpha/beta-fold hydrolase
MSPSPATTSIIENEEEKEELTFFDSASEPVEEQKDVPVDENAYRLREYGTTDIQDEPHRTRSRRRVEGSFRKFSKRLSRQFSQRRSSIIESLPDTPAGWAVLISAVFSATLGYEIQLQKNLTAPPVAFGQFYPGGRLQSIYEKMTEKADSILSRPIQPSLFVGTRGMVASCAAYLLAGPSKKEEHVKFREMFRMTQDGATIAVDFEVPRQSKRELQLLSVGERKAQIVNGPIRQPVVIILHGINNDASFGYMQSLMRTFANRGWVAAAMNFRGCGGIPLTTPRGYNGAYTGDVRNLVLQISARLDKNVQLFLVGYSLGANILTKYMGEEGLSGTLPKCVAGAVSLGNPLSIHSANIPSPFNVLMGLGVKKVYLGHWRTLRQMRDSAFQSAVREGFLASTIGNFDKAVSKVLIRNDAFYPYGTRIGYKCGESYWTDASSYRLIRFVSVPFLHLTSQDDFLVAGPSRNKLAFSLANPNVMVAETRCGGHLGWQESPPNSKGILDFGASSWADIATADFFQAIMDTNVGDSPSSSGDYLSGALDSEWKRRKEDALQSLSELRSRL